MCVKHNEDWFPEARNPEDLLVINSRCMVRRREGHCVVLVSGIALAQYAQTDRMAEAYAMVHLVEQGWASQQELAQAFGYSVRTLRRHQQRFDADGLAALGRGSGYPKGRWRLSASRSSLIHRLKSQGCSNREIARQIGVGENAVRKVLRRLGWNANRPMQTELSLEEEVPAHLNLSASASATMALASPGSTPGAHPNLSAFGSVKADVPLSQDCDRAHRGADRLLARLGLLEDAPPLFGSAPAVPRAGVLLALPVLVASGVFECAQQIYGSLGPAFYGLRTSLLTLLLMALWRIKRPEGLKEYSPQDLGRVLGLDRAPEVKTLRRKLARLAAAGKAAPFGQALARQRVSLRGEALGFLYIDGHVRVYHGKHTLPKAHVTRMRISLPATSDYWVNDTAGDPLFVVTAQANAGLVKMLPGILEQIRALAGQRRVTVVFDRGGYSPKLFQHILAGFDLLTYRKGPYRSIPRKRFRLCRTRRDGKTITYRLADQEVRLLGGELRLRQVTRRMDNGHQTPILTSRRDLPAAQVAYQMFERWRQENFFKYLREEYALDALVEYAAVPDDPSREVPNPAWAAAEAQLRQAQAHLDRLQAEYGLEALTNLEDQRRTMRGFKTAHGKLGQIIWNAWQRVLQLEKRRAAVPRRVPVQAVTEQPVVKLAPERKHLTNLIKMLAYQAESDLLRLVSPHYRRADDEGRTLLQAALASAAELEVTKTELQVTLAAQSSPHRTRAIAALCRELNQTQTTFPGSRLRLRYAIRGAFEGKSGHST
jgi:DNA-binding CsgD family transcriptional regulator